MFRAAGALLPSPPPPPPPPPPASLLGTRKPHFTLERRHLLEYHINASLPFYNVGGGGSIQSRDLFKISFLLHCSARGHFTTRGRWGTGLVHSQSGPLNRLYCYLLPAKIQCSPATYIDCTIMDTKRTRITAYISARLRARLKRG